MAFVPNRFETTDARILSDSAASEAEFRGGHNFGRHSTEARATIMVRPIRPEEAP